MSEAFQVMRVKIATGTYKSKLPYGTTAEESDDYTDDRERLGQIFKRDLIEAFGVEGNPKADLCVKIAYECGIYAGHMAILGHFAQLVELIR